MARVRKPNADFIVQEKTPPLYDWLKDGYIKLLPEVEKVIRNRLNSNSTLDGEPSNQLKVDTIIPAELTLEIDGIGGMVPGDVIQTDYIQPKYNTNFYAGEVDFGPFTYFQVVGANQKVDSATWTTELVTKMRINHIPDYSSLKVGNQEKTEEIEEEIIEAEQIEEVVNEPQKIERIDKKKPPPSTPANLPEETAAADQIDNDDYEEILLQGPKLHPELEAILDKGTVNIATKSRTFGIGTLEEHIATENLRRNTSNQILLPKISRGLGDVIQEGSTYSNLQLGNQGFKLNIEAYEQPPQRPSIPVPTDDEDIADDVTLDVLEFDEFEPFDEPPKPITMKKLPEESVEDRIKQTEIKNPIQTKKELVFVKRESTYKGSYWQNDKYLYVSPHHPEWRPIFQFQDGSRRSFDTIAETGERAVKTIRAARDYSERRRYWDDNIESPKPEGKSLLSKRGGSSTERDFYGPFNTPY